MHRRHSASADLVRFLIRFAMMNVHRSALGLSIPPNRWQHQITSGSACPACSCSKTAVVQIHQKQRFY